MNPYELRRNDYLAQLKDKMSTLHPKKQQYMHFLHKYAHKTATLHIESNYV